MGSVASPFVKSDFVCYRDWEDALVSFLCHEGLHPDAALWVAAAAPAKEDAAFCALFLSNILGTNKEFAVSAENAYNAFRQLNEKQVGAKEYEHWLQSGWLNVSRVANAVLTQMRDASKR